MTTTTLPTHYKPKRRLISPDELAQKFGFTVDWVYRHYRALQEKCAMPPPFMMARERQHLRWDEKAIDLWLDTLMPEMLQRVELAQNGMGDRVTITVDPVAMSETEQRLLQRARELA